MDDALAVISASTDNIEIMQKVLEKQALALGISREELTPEQWLHEFYARRKGSGKSVDRRLTRGEVTENG
jgi:type IV secretion system protein VirB4